MEVPGRRLSQQGPAGAGKTGWVQRAESFHPIWSCYSWCDSPEFRLWYFFQNPSTVDKVFTPWACLEVRFQHSEMFSSGLIYPEYERGSFYCPVVKQQDWRPKDDQIWFQPLPQTSSDFRPAITPCWLLVSHLQGKEDPILFPHPSLELFLCLQGTRRGLGIRWSFGTLPLKSQ